MLFADDCLLFVRAELGHLSYLKQLLIQYEEVAGQKVNLDKSEFMCSPNLNSHMRAMFANYLGMKQLKSHTKYLGMPLVVVQNRKETFRSLEDKMGRKV